MIIWSQIFRLKQVFVIGQQQQKLNWFLVNKSNKVFPITNISVYRLKITLKKPLLCHLLTRQPCNHLLRCIQIKNNNFYLINLQFTSILFYFRNVLLKLANMRTRQISGTPSSPCSEHWKKWKWFDSGN